MMILVCFSRSGIGSIIALPEKETFTHRLFVEKMADDFDKERAERRPKKRARGRFLHLDNVPTHWAEDDFNHLRITRLFHPPDSPDLSQCDFWLSRNLKTKLEGNILTSIMELMAKVNEIFIYIP
jgi:hypothetical protein